ncbi:TPA: hypothetical protein RY409_003631 [Escherichia albertii]|uniref:hypothetical protein n=1 Tax=Escherichia albertii TaxID=208962 RepID=UPI000743DB1D|nr:hypothetical protein [Escherichia albertii]EFC7612544.1 hypothetical protein [Escherichia albertii]EHK6580239.1 hypothetical protein [Escherichia albertii]EHW5857583.1 hypothetical protein [Escherichia albertii]MCU7301148.1 hypothetical protein [Escherichia albertii]MCV3220949.1 hypothetical protein [Escherichia albertii]
MTIRKWILFLVLAVSCSVQAKPKGITVQDVKYLALKECLTSHYRERTPADAFFAPGHDHSFLVERYALDNAGKWNALRKFVAKETKGFDKLTMSLYPDSAKDGNNVLMLCMKFYESEKLDKFAHNLFK